MSGTLNILMLPLFGIKPVSPVFVGPPHPHKNKSVNFHHVTLWLLQYTPSCWRPAVRLPCGSSGVLLFPEKNICSVVWLPVIFHISAEYFPFKKIWFSIASSFSFYFFVPILYLPHVLEKSFNVINIWQLCQKRKQTQFLVVENGSWTGVLFYKCVFWVNEWLDLSVQSGAIN